MSDGAGVRADIVVSGRVQGVGFREFSRKAAERIGVVGYAMNLHDGRVSVVAEGTRESVDTLIAELRRGPRLGRVENVEIRWGAARGEFGAFGIRYAGRDT